MPIKKSAKKSLKQSKVRAARNAKVVRALKLVTKKTLGAIDKKTEEAKKMAQAACQEIDKACQKGVLKKNTAARKKSRLMKKLNQALKK